MYSDCCRLFSLPSADIRYRGCSFRLASDRPARFCQPSYIVSAERDKKSILDNIAGRSNKIGKGETCVLNPAMFPTSVGGQIHLNIVTI